MRSVCGTRFIDENAAKKTLSNGGPRFTALSAPDGLPMQRATVIAATPARRWRLPISAAIHGLLSLGGTLVLDAGCFRCRGGAGSGGRGAERAERRRRERREWDEAGGVDEQRSTQRGPHAPERAVAAQSSLPAT